MHEIVPGNAQVLQTCLRGPAQWPKIERGRGDPARTATLHACGERTTWSDARRGRDPAHPASRGRIGLAPPPQRPGVARPGQKVARASTLV